MTAAIDMFIEEARFVNIEGAIEILGAQLKGSGAEKSGPCPVCGGKDRFSINTAKNAWNCRGAGQGGRDAISLIAHARGYDLNIRTGLLAACSELLGRPVPDGGEVETQEQKDERAARLVEAECKRKIQQAERDAEQERYREKEIKQAFGIWTAASSTAMLNVAAYLAGRTGIQIGVVMANMSPDLRFSKLQTYWHGKDDRGHAIAFHEGPAMIAPMVNQSGEVVGCHITWIDLTRKPKLRPQLIADSEPLPTKKMRGHKKGCLIPVVGSRSAARWVVGEGIETVLAVAGTEGFPEDTFYAAAGDIGNMAGPADPTSFFAHPDLKKKTSNGRNQSVRVAGPVPGGDAGDAFYVDDHVAELTLLADGDSEFVATATAMVRAKARHSRDGLSIDVAWPPTGKDFADVTSGAR